MMNNNETIEKLVKLGLNLKEATVYYTLINKQSLTLLEISRLSSINRTTAYRIVDKLERKGLVIQEMDQYKMKFRTTSPDNLKRLLLEKEEKLNQQKHTASLLIKDLKKAQTQRSSNTQVLYYKGIEGSRQLLWNTLRAKDGIFGYGYLTLNKSVGAKFAEKFRQEVVKRKILSQEIQNRPKDIQNMDFNYTQVKDYRLFFERRFIPKSLVEIHHDTYIYNDIFAFHYFYKGELFGIEIKNSEIAKTQKQIFKVLWNMAKRK